MLTFDLAAGGVPTPHLLPCNNSKDMITSEACELKEQNKLKCYI